MDQGRAGVYLRISADREGRALGVERQREDCLRLVEREGLTLAEVFEDNDISASTRSRKPRPAYRQMIKSAQARDLDVIIAFSSSRLTRRPAEWEQLIDLYEQTGTRILLVKSGDVDFTTARGRRRLRDDAARDAEYAEEVGELVHRAVRQRAERGERHGGRAKYGYRFVRSESGHVLGMEIDPAAAAVLKEAASRFAAGETLYSIVSDLRHRGIKRGDTGWTTRSLGRDLASPTPAGLREYDGQLIEGNWEAILDRATWESCRARLRDPNRPMLGDSSRATYAKFPLSGLLRCGRCGARLFASPRHGRLSFICASEQVAGGCGGLRILSADLEDELGRLAVNVLASEEVQRAVEAATAMDADAARRRALSEAITEDQRRLHAIEDMLTDGLLDRVGYLRQRSRLTDRITQAQEELRRTTSKLSITLLPAAEEAWRRWEADNDEHERPFRRTLLHAMIRQVVIGPHPKGAPTRPHPDAERRREQVTKRITKIDWVV